MLMEITGRMRTMKGACLHVRLGSEDLTQWVIIQVIWMSGLQRGEVVVV